MLYFIVVLIAGTAFITFHMLLRIVWFERRLVSLRLELIHREIEHVKSDKTLHSKSKEDIKQIRRIVRKAGIQFFSLFTPRRMLSEYEKLVVLAGRPYRLKALDWIAIHAVIIFGSPLLTFLFLGQRLEQHTFELIALFFAQMIFGVVIPRSILVRKKRIRLERLQEQMPGMIDLLTISVEAGSSLEGAIQKVGERIGDPMSREFEGVLADIRLGKTREEAILNLKERVPIDDMKSFVRVMVQSQKTGLSIGDILRMVSADIRERKKMRVKERIGKSVIQILIPVVLFIMPTTIIIVLGPVVLKIVRIIQGITMF